MNFEEILNENQLKAVKHKDGPLLILAGAGSGKTRVITYRIAYLISVYGISPENILAVTFTNKAAEEMKGRIEKVVGKKAEKIWMSTFHSFGCRILRNHCDKIGYSKNFSIYDEDDRERLVKECMNFAKISEKQIKPYEVIRKIQDIKNQLLTPEEFYSYANDYNSKLVARIYEIYEEKLKFNNAFDFDDLIKKPIELFRIDKEILNKYQEKFKYILIDEYQDINNSQYVLVSTLAEKYKNICVVGDDDQSIYRFRGADITNILDFEEDYPDATVIRLEQNYRSTKTILKAAHSVISKNKGRKDKELWTENEQGQKIVLTYTEDATKEAEAILKEVDRLLRTTDANLKDMSVFYRTNAQSRVIEDCFRRNGIPYKLIGGIQFYGRMEIKDILAYLRLIVNPNDILSFKRVINIPPRGIGEASITKLEEYAIENEMSIFDAIKDIQNIPDIKESIKESFYQFYNMIKGISENRNNMSLTEIVKTILSETRYIDYWKSDASIKSDERIENVRELVSAISEFEEKRKDATLEDFLNQVALITDIDRMDKNANAITLMTIHSAKGLEFDNVFIAGMNEDLFPHKNCIDEPGGIEEERRLCYVGMTRAKKRLFLFTTLFRRQYGSKNISSVSRFIDEIPYELLEIKGKTLIKEYINKDSFIEDMQPRFEEYIDETPLYKPGEKVRHKIMGEGVILKIEPHGDDYKLTVVFKKHGKKVLSANFAGLEKI
ncbi:MAG: UvrD-helicase domain-containing protein [Candidatus Goldbacteria bacterium]|nr:UvrD-helicase domain-containing protein [Candidatus Goldiibacteriota bacterium]